jgi:hypothetical protein
VANFRGVEKGKNAPLAAKTQKGGIPIINEPRCKVCQSTHRQLIDTMLAKGMTYSEIERQMEFAQIPRRSISLHAQKHLGYEAAAVRKVIEEEAEAASRNFDEGVGRIITKKAYLEIALQKAHDALLNDDVMVEPKDAVKIIETLAKMEESGQVEALDSLRAQFQMFMQAVKEVVAKEHWNAIVTRTLSRATRPLPRPAWTPS